MINDANPNAAYLTLKGYDALKFLGGRQGDEDRRSLRNSERHGAFGELADGVEGGTERGAEGI